MTKNIFTAMCCNKGIEQINFNRTLKSESFNTHLPGKIQLQENILVATYRLTTAITNKILNCLETAQAIIVDGEISFSSSAGSCNFERSTFRDEHHGHSRDLRLITNTERTLLSEILAGRKFPGFAIFLLNRKI